MGITVLGDDDLKWDDRHFANLDAVLHKEFQVLNVLGGEPFYNRRLLQTLSDIPVAVARKATLQIITNGTVYNQQWQSVMEKFGLVRIMFSVDAVDDLYAYMRFPGRWAEVSENIRAISALPGVKSMINCTVQNLNILYLDRVIDWCLAHDIWLELPVLQHPRYLAMINLPVELRSLARDRLRTWCQRYTQPNVLGPLQDFLALFERNLDREDAVLWQEFCQEIGRRDQVRGNSWQQFLSTQIEKEQA
jgi:MoaA/NifB/PqqE/SkfB family radical SAM enzyme